jgi:hypothetical protein
LQRRLIVFMTMKQVNSYHGGVIFDTERSYMDYLR